MSEKFNIIPRVENQDVGESLIEISKGLADAIRQHPVRALTVAGASVIAVGGLYTLRGKRFKIKAKKGDWEIEVEVDSNNSKSMTTEWEE